MTGYPSTSESPGNTTSDHMTSDIDLSASESPSNGKPAYNPSKVNLASFGSQNDTLPDYPKCKRFSKTISVYQN